MEERTTPQLKQWFVREWDNAFFYCETIEDKYVEGHGFINNKFDGLLYFDRLYFSWEFKETTYEFIEDYFDATNNRPENLECVFSTQPTMISLPIKDYNRLRKLEIKEQIKKLKKELKGL